MTIAVIGTGFIGGTLGRAFARAGLPTVFGSRAPETDTAAQDTAAQDTAAQNTGATTTTIAEAISQADTVVLAIPSAAVAELLETYGDVLAGKLVIDAANNVGGPVAHHAEQVARYAPEARYARAFNTLGGENFADPVFDGTPADLFFSAPQGDRATVETLIGALGMRPMYVGENQQDTVDGVLRLWFALAIAQGHGRHLAFHTLTRAADSG